MKQASQLVNLTDKQKILIYAGCFTIGIFLILFIIISGLRAKIKNLHQQIRIEEANLKIATDIEKRKDTILADYKEYKKFLNDKDITDKELFSIFLKEIEKIAQESGLSILNLTPQNEPKESKDYRKYTADLRAEASIDKLLNFLYMIENNKLLLKIDKLTLAPKDELATAIKIDAAISIAIP